MSSSNRKDELVSSSASSSSRLLGLVSSTSTIQAALPVRPRVAQEIDAKMKSTLAMLEVKQILLQRFHRHLETKVSGTVSGRIPDTAAA